MAYRLASLDALTRSLSRLPGIGQKSAARLALHIVRMGAEEARELARSIELVKEKVGLCSVCFNLTEADPCPICADPARLRQLVCVVEGPGDLLAVERAGGYRGTYHVLHGVLSPMEGVGPEELKVAELMERIEREGVQELVLATNPSAEGEATAAYLARLLAGRLKLTRIAYGIPFGGDLKYCDELTLKKALEARRALD